VNNGLKDCSFIIDHYTCEKKYIINPKTNRKIVSDYLITIFPTDAFQMEQWRINTHQKNIKNHRIDQK